MAQTLSARAALVREQSVFVHAAILAAHAASEPVAAFRAGEVRFFFLLFTNWVEQDLTRPEQDIDLTQVRRALDRIVDAGWARRIARARGKPATRTPTYSVTPAGLIGLAESLAEAHRSFEEALFVCAFAASYRRAILARIQLTAAARRRVDALLAPERLLSVARRRAGAVAADLEERVTSSRELARAARRARDEGATDAETVQRLEALGAYQLQRVRPLRDVLLALPDDLRKFELDAGMGLRARLVFEPLAARARAECAILDDLATQLAEASKMG